MQRKLILISLVSLVLLECKNPNKPISTGVPKRTERDAYYERVPDAPLDLYCHLDNLIDAEVRKNVCLNTLFNQYGNLSLDLGIVIKDNKLDTVEVQTLYFDEEGFPKKDTVAISILAPILNRMNLSEIQVLSHVQSADFATRVQWERFCIGHVHVSKPGIQTAVDSLNRKH